MLHKNTHQPQKRLFVQRCAGLQQHAQSHKEKVPQMQCNVVVLEVPAPWGDPVVQAHIVGDSHGGGR